MPVLPLQTCKLIQHCTYFYGLNFCAQLDQREANLFFHLINHLYERSSNILKSNKSSDEWGNLIGDQVITKAILDRLLHRVKVIHGGEEEESHRMKNRKSIFSVEV